jgi:hypothetical protein
VAVKREDPNAAISSVPLERLNHKEFNKKEITIDAPVDTERDTSTVGGRTTADLGAVVDSTGDDDIIIDSK